jgi:hypothetical protein
MKEVAAVTKDLCLVVPLNSKALPCMHAPKARFENLRNLVSYSLVVIT